jgi:CysZ protein
MIAHVIQLREKISFMTSSQTARQENGVHYFRQGWTLISLPGIRRFVILPLAVNVVLMGGAFWWLFTKLG